MRRFYAILAVLVLVVAAPAVRVQRPPTNWSDYGGAPDNARHVALEPDRQDQPATSSASRGPIRAATRSRTCSTRSSSTTSRTCSPGTTRSSPSTRPPARKSGSTRTCAASPRAGINYWESKDRSDRRLLFQMNSYLQAIDARTGKSIMTFGTDGVVNLREGLRRDPATLVKVQSSNPGKVFENLIILGSAAGEHYMAPPGDIRAYDVVTGRLAWQFHTVPHPGEFGYETWPKDAWKYVGGANNWGELSSTPRAASPTSRPARRPTTTTAPTVTARTSSARRCWRSTRAPASGCGTSRWCTTISGTTTTPPRRSWRRSPTTASAGHRRAGGQDRLPVRVRPRHRRADLADRGAARSRPATSRARRRGRRSRFPPRRRPSPVSHSRSPTSTRTSSRRGSAPSGRSASAARATRGCSRRRRSATPCRFPARKAAPTGAPPRPIRPAGWSTC